MNMSTLQKLVYPEEIWAGTDHSLLLAREAHDLIMAGAFNSRMAQQPVADAVPYNFTMQGTLGVVSVRGPLVNNDSPYNQYAGITSYADVRRAMIYAATNASVQSILLDVESGGGAVIGMMDTADLIAMIDKGVKPVYSYSGGQMASAAYGLGASARKVYVSSTTTSGSVGVIATHVEYSKALKEAGIGTTVVRSGKFKALASSVEPLSDAALEQLQGQLDAAYGVFAPAMAERRGVSMAVFEKSMGQGREFFGAQALDAGMADGVMNYDAVVSLITKKNLDTSANSANTAGNHTRGANMTRQALTDQQIAALAAGGGIELDAAALAAAAITAAADKEAADKVIADKAVADLAAAAVVTEAQSGQAALVTYLQTQIKERDAAALASGVELAALKAKVASMEANHAGLVQIAGHSVTHMNNALRKPKIDFTNLSAESLCAHHAAIEVEYKAAFKVGGVAALSTDAGASATLPPDHSARIAATRFPQANK